LQRQGVNGNRVEPIAHLADHLAQPKQPKAAILTQQLAIADRRRIFCAFLHSSSHALSIAKEKEKGALCN